MQTHLSAESDFVDGWVLYTTIYPKRNTESKSRRLRKPLSEPIYAMSQNGQYNGREVYRVVKKD